MIEFNDRRAAPNHKTIADVKAAHEAGGGKFFDKSSIKFFGSKVGGQVFNGRHFVTSEAQPASYGEQNFPAGKRAYTVREVGPGGHISTVGDFQAHPTRSAAVRAAKALGDPPSLGLDRQFADHRQPDQFLNSLRRGR